MGINKLVYGGEVKFDLTADTVTQDKLLRGFTAHDKAGEAITGTCDYDADTQDATAAVAEILVGKTAYARGTKLEGVMPNNGSVTGAISSKDDEYTIPQGYHDGSGKVSIDETEKAKLTGSNIREGITVLGVVGTMSGTEDANPQSKQVVPSLVSSITVVPDEGYNYLSQVIVEKVPYAESQNAAGGITVTIG